MDIYVDARGDSAVVVIGPTLAAVCGSCARKRAKERLAPTLGFVFFGRVSPAYQAGLSRVVDDTWWAAPMVRPRRGATGRDLISMDADPVGHLIRVPGHDGNVRLPPKPQGLALAYFLLDPAQGMKVQFPRCPHCRNSPQLRDDNLFAKVQRPLGEHRSYVRV